MGQFFLGSRSLCADIPKDRLTCRPGDCIGHKSVPHEADRTIKGDSLKKGGRLSFRRVLCLSGFAGTGTRKGCVIIMETGQIEDCFCFLPQPVFLSRVGHLWLYAILDDAGLSHYPGLLPPVAAVPCAAAKMVGRPPAGCDRGSAPGFCVGPYPLGWMGRFLLGWLAALYLRPGNRLPRRLDRLCRPYPRPEDPAPIPSPRQG